MGIVKTDREDKEWQILVLVYRNIVQLINRRKSLPEAKQDGMLSWKWLGFDKFFENLAHFLYTGAP